MDFFEEFIDNVYEFMVLEILGVVKCIFEGEFGYVCVCGEVGCVVLVWMGYFYFDFKDDCNVIVLVSWKG